MDEGAGKASGARNQPRRPSGTGASGFEPAIGETLVPADELQSRVETMAGEISRDYEGRDLVMIGILKGAVLFLGDLMRFLTVPCEIDFMAVSSYGSETHSSRGVRILKDLYASIQGRDRLILRGIIRPR